MGEEKCQEQDIFYPEMIGEIMEKIIQILILILFLNNLNKCNTFIKIHPCNLMLSIT